MINNAGIAGRTPEGGFATAAEETADSLRTSFETNVFGVVRVIRAFLPLLEINAVGPGFTATDLNGHTGTQSTQEGAEIIVRMAEISREGPSGGFFDVRGTIVW